MTTLAEQIAALESKLADYESRQVPLSAESLWRIFNDHDGGHDTSILAVAGAALVAAESPAAVNAAMVAYERGPITPPSAMLAAIRAAHDAAIDGGCSAARESDEPQRLAEVAESLGGINPALGWSYVIGEIRSIRRRFDAEVEHHKLTVKDRDKWLDEAKRLEKERDVWRTNAERAYEERDDLRRQLDETSRALVERTNERGRLTEEIEGLRYERDNVRGQLDALTRPIDGVEELARVGWRASLKDERANPEIDAGDIRQAQAIASRVIGALRSAFILTQAGNHSDVASTWIEDFDNAVASLKIEPAKVEQAPKREPFELPHKDYSRNDDAIRDRIREIEHRLEAGGL